MRKRTALALMGAMVLLILDSRCAADSARAAIELCLHTLVPVLFPLFVLGAMLVPWLSSVRVPMLSRVLGVPEGSEGLLVLGCLGGFPVGAACVAQAVDSGGLERADGKRMLGIASFCGPSFLFGIIGTAFSLREGAVLFLIQLQTALTVAAYWPSPSRAACGVGQMEPVSLPGALRRAIGSMASVCGWVTMAGVAAGFLRRWLGPLLPELAQAVLTGLLELTTGVFALEGLPCPIVPCAAFVCFGGVSVLLQIGGLAAAAGIPMGDCVRQKALQGILGAVLAALWLCLGPAALVLGFLPLAAKIAVEISGRMVYNGPRKEGI